MVGSVQQRQHIQKEQLHGRCERKDEGNGCDTSSQRALGVGTIEDSSSKSYRHNRGKDSSPRSALGPYKLSLLIILNEIFYREYAYSIHSLQLS